MYFLPEEEIKACSISYRLERNLKLMRVIYLPKKPQHYEYVTKYGSELILYSINWDTLEITGHKFDHKGIVLKYNCGKISNPSPIAWSAVAVESLPIVAVYHAVKGCKKFKMAFFDISGNASGEKIHVKDILFDLGYVYRRSTILTKSNFVAVFFNFYRKSNSLKPWWKSRLGTSNEIMTEWSFHCLFVLFEIQLTGDNYYECIEISRINLEEYVEGSFDIEDMICNKTEQKIIFQLQTLRNLPSELILVLYDTKRKSILQTFVAFENPRYCMAYFVNHLDFEGGIIITVSYNSNEIKMFTSDGKNKFIFFSCLSFAFDNTLSPCTYYPYCISNCKNQLLFFQVRRNHVKVCDLLDVSNSAFLPIATDERPLRFQFNETGEEIYIYDNKKMYIYLCKPILKSLALLSASAVSKRYTKSKLVEMRLPKQLYKYF